MLSSRPIRLIILAVTLVLLAGGTLYLILATPRYMVLPLTAPMAHLPNGGWSYEERAQRVWINEGEPFSVWRVSALALPPLYRDWQDVVSYLEPQLQSLGWERGSASCGTQLPEASFLQEVPNGYIGFTRIGANPDELGPTVCMAAWPDEEAQSFNVIVQSSNPSFFLRLARW